MVLLISGDIATAQPPCPTFRPVPEAEIRRLSQNDKLFRFPGGIVAVVQQMTVDTDGSALAYHPRDLGTSYLCDGLDPYDEMSQSCDTDKTAGSRCFTEVRAAEQASWDSSKSGPFCVYGFEAHGVPAPGTAKRVWGKHFAADPIPIQAGSDPAPGFFISTTSFSDPTHPEKSQRHYIDADIVPYVVVPGKLVGKGKDFSTGLTPAWAWNIGTDYESPAVVGDTGSSFGEGSVALAQVLQNNAIVPLVVDQILGSKTHAVPFPYVRARTGAVRASSGATGTIIFVYFTNAPGVPNLSDQSLRQATVGAFKALGGEANVKACVAKLATSD
jgi:hypothetical protein